MKFEKLGEDIYIPQNGDLSLKDKTNIKFNYYLKTRVNGETIVLDITSKLFSEEEMFVKKSCYRVRLGDIENCVKSSIIDHMKSLGIANSEIPDSLKNKSYTGRKWSNPEFA